MRANAKETSSAPYAVLRPSRNGSEGSGCVDDWFPQKPKGMHCSTFSRLARRYLNSVSAMNRGAAAHFGIYL